MRNALEENLLTIGDSGRGRRPPTTSLAAWVTRPAPFIQVPPGELADLEAATGVWTGVGLAERGRKLFAVKLRAVSHRHREEFDAALGRLMDGEGLAMRAGPRENLKMDLLTLERDAITSRQELEFGYLSRGARRRNRRRVRPYGMLYGNRAFLVGPKRIGEGTPCSGGWRTVTRTKARIRPSRPEKRAWRSLAESIPLHLMPTDRRKQGVTAVWGET